MDDDEAAFFSRPKRKVSAVEASPVKRPPTLAQVEVLEDSDENTDTEDDDDTKKLALAKSRDSGTASSPTKIKQTAIKNKFISIYSSSDSESGDRCTNGQKKRPRHESSRASTRTAARRARERSDSLTPPPQLSPRGLRQGQTLVQNVFTRTKPVSFVSEPAQPVFVPDEAEILFEEQMRAREATLERTDTTTSGDVASLQKQASNATPVPDDTLEIIIRGVYVDLPSSSSIIKEVKLWETPRMLRIRLNMKLSIAKIGFCKEAGMSGIQDGVKFVRPEDKRCMSEIVLVHHNIRIFDHSTPHDLGISAGDQPFFEAHTKEGWSYLEAHPELRAQTSVQPSHGHKHGNGNSGAATDHGHEAGGIGDNAEDAMKITLQAKNGSELKVRVRPSTKISSIIAGFRSKFGTPETATVNLRFEGDILEGTVGETDVEDGDVVDVTII